MIDGWLPPPEPDWLQEDTEPDSMPLLGAVKITAGDPYVWTGGSWLKMSLLAAPPVLNPNSGLFNVVIS